MVVYTELFIRMMTDMSIPWLQLNEDEMDLPLEGFTDVTDDDAIGSPDEDHVEVAEALDTIRIDDAIQPNLRKHHVWMSKAPKRKRTLSQASPPKVRKCSYTYAFF